MGVGNQKSVEAEFDAFVDAFGHDMYRAAWLLCGEPHLAEDLVQEAFVRIYGHLAKGRTIDYPKAFTRAVLVRVYIEWRRRRSSLELVTNTFEDRAAESADLDLRPTISAALLTLGSTDRAIVVLRYYDDLPAEQVADLLGLTAGAVRKRAARALPKVRAALSGDVDCTLST